MATSQRMLNHVKKQDASGTWFNGSSHGFCPAFWMCQEVSGHDFRS